MKFPFAAMVLILLAGVCFIFFIVANYLYDNPDTGLFTLLQKSANETMNEGHRAWFGVRLEHIRTGFGLSAALLFTLAIVVFIAQSVDNRSQ
jgi:putative exporter of polyketide antibiotics